jgi:uncharacterized membrane protein SpoIIM required for sporulation
MAESIPAASSSKALGELRSYHFRREREATWRELDRLIAGAGSGSGGLSPEELFRLPHLYRSTISSLSVARTISLDQNLLAYLENLATRSYLFVYASRDTLAGMVASFFAWRLSAAVHAARWYLLAAAVLMAAGIMAGYFLVSQEPDRFYSFVPRGLAEGRSPNASTDYLRSTLKQGLSEDDTPDAYRFASFLFSNNAQVGLLAFALGFMLGLPVVVLLFYNGMQLGALAAVFAARGLSFEFWGWISVHGATELLAIAMCGAAGLMLGHAMAFPGRQSRLATLAAQGRRTALIVLGAIAAFGLAAVLEGLVRQTVLDAPARYAIGLSIGAVLLAYLLRRPRRAALA